MSERMTSVHLPSLGSGNGLAEYGRQDPKKMIYRLRRRAQIEKEEAERILAAPDSEFVVETYRGIHAQRDHEQLWPTTETEEMSENIPALIAEARKFDTRPAEYAMRLNGAHDLIARLADALESLSAPTASDTEPVTEAQISAVTIAIQVHALGENWGDDGVAFVGCDCGKWFGKSTEGGWDRARRHVARMALNVSRLTTVQPVQVEVTTGEVEHAAVPGGESNDG